MDFEIRHSDNRLLKPVIYALNRNCKEVHVSPGTGGMRIMGVSADNSAGLTVQIPADAFDTYEVDGASAFRTSASNLYDAFRNTKKTESIALTVEDHDLERFYNYYTVGTDEKKVLKDKDLSPEDLDTAEVSDLTGEVEYESGGLTQTAEIDVEKADKILGEHNGGKFVVEAGGDRVDVDNPARLLGAAEVPEKPPRETAADAGVNGKDFSKAVRALDKTSENTYLGTRDGTLVLYGEGDTDDVYATPESDVTGRSGGHYSTELLDNLRMSLDKKASTRLTLSIPPEPDLDDGGDEIPHILWAEFAIEEADVTWYAAPRIRRNEDSESVSDVFERIDPATYDPVENARLTAESRGGDLKAWFKTVGGKVDEYKLSVEPDGLYTKAVDPANVGMVEMDLGAGAFDAYDWSQPSGRLYDQDRVIGVNNGRLLDMLRLTTKTEDVALHVTATDATVSLVVDTEHFTATLATINPDNIRRRPDLPGLEMPGRVSVQVEDLVDAVDQTDAKSDHTGLVIYDGEFYAGAEGDIEDVWVPIDTSSGEGFAVSLFSNDYLDDMIGAVPRGYDDATLDLFTGREFPVIMETSIGEPEAEFTFMIAPRIQSEENETAIQDLLQEHDLDPFRIRDAPGLFAVNQDDEGDTVVRNEDVEDDPEPESDPEPDTSTAENPNEDADVYDPTDEWGPTMDTPIPRDERENAEIDGYDKRELVGTGLSPEDFNPVRGGGQDGSIHPDDADRPDRVEQFEEMAADIYDPTDEGNVSDEEFRVGPNGVAVPREIGDFFLVNQAKNGRPLYRNRANKNQLRINRSYDTDVVHRRYYVEFREDHTKSGMEANTVTVGSGLSPTEAMEALEEYARERTNADTADVGVVDVSALEAGDLIEVEYESTRTSATADNKTVRGEVVGVRPSTVEFEGDDGTYTLDVDGGTAVELSKDDQYGNPNRLGYPETVATVGTPGDVEAAEEAGVYDPTDEFDPEDMEEPSEHYVMGEGRRKTLDAIEQKDRLNDVQTFDTIEEMVNAVREISLARRDGRTYMAPDEDVTDALKNYYQNLPEEAKSAYLNDDTIHRRINAARKAFNRWLGKKKREQEMPSPVEAGPSNYPADKAREVSQYAREGSEELSERLDKVRAAAKGARQRALNEIGTSVGEVNEQQREQKRQEGREEFNKGDFAIWSDTVYGKAVWGVKRVNKKSLRLRRPHRDREGEYDETRAELDSSRLRGPIPAEAIENFDADDLDGNVNESVLVADEADTAAEARRLLFGEEWVEENLDDAEPVETGDQYADADEFTDEERETLATAAADGDLKTVLSTAGAPTSGIMWAKDYDNAGVSDVSDLVDTYDDRGDFENIRGIGPATSEDLERAIPIIRDAVENGDTGPEDLMGEAGPGYFVTNDDGAINGPFYDKDKAEDVADELDGGYTVEMDDKRLTREPETGDFLWFDYEDGGGGIAGYVTRVEDTQALIRVSDGDEPATYDWDTEEIIMPNGSKESVERVERSEESSAEPGDTLDADQPGGGVDVPEEDDLSDALQAQGVNRLTANHLDAAHDSMADLEESVASTDDLTDLRGVTEKSVSEVRSVFDVDAPADDGDDVPEAVEEAGTLPGGFEYDGVYPSPPMADDAADRAGPIYSWKLDSDSMVGVYQNDEYDDDGHPYTAAKWVNPKGGNPFWKHTHIAETWGAAVAAAERNADHRTFILESEPGENYEDWEARTGGTSYEPTKRPPWEETDGEDRTEHEEAVEEAADTDESDELPQGALSALKKNWAVYKRGLKEGREAAEEVEEYQDVRKDAVEAAAIINDIRAAHGQDPINFDGVPAIPGADEIGGPITPDDPGVSLDFSWSADPYDPTEEV